MILPGEWYTLAVGAAGAVLGVRVGQGKAKKEAVLVPEAFRQI